MCSCIYVLHRQAKCFSMERVHLNLFHSSLYSLGISKHEFMTPDTFILHMRILRPTERK